MKTQILPNWCKKIGLILFLIFSVLGGRDDFIAGFNSAYSATQDNEATESSLDNLIADFTGIPNAVHIFNIIAIIGMLMYMLSKEKVEDDYINRLRLESFQLTAIVGLLITIILYTISQDIKLTLDYFIFLFIWFYLITFFIKKRLY